MKMDLNLVRTILWFSVYAIVSHGNELNCRFCFKYYLESCDGTYRVEIGNLALSENDLQFTKQCSNKPFITEHGLLGGGTPVISSGLSEQNLILLNGEVVGHGGESSVEIENDQAINTDVGNTDFKPKKQPSSVGESVDTDCHLTINTEDEDNINQQHNPGGVKPDQNLRNSEELEDSDSKIILNTEEENQPEYPDNFQPNQNQNSDGASVGTVSLQINTEGESNVRQTEYPDDRQPDQHPSHGGSVDTNSQLIKTEDENADSQSQYPHGLTYGLHHFYNEGSVETGYLIHNESKNTVHVPHHSDVLKPDQFQEAENQPQYPIDFTSNQPPSNDKDYINIDHQVYPKPDEKPTFDEKLESTEQNQPKYPNHDNGYIETDDQTKIIESEKTVDQPQKPSDPKPDQHSSHGGSVDTNSQLIKTEDENADSQSQYPSGLTYDIHHVYNEGSVETGYLIHNESKNTVNEPHYSDVLKTDQFLNYDEGSEEAENIQPQYYTDFTPNQPPSNDKGDIKIDHQAIDTGSEIILHNPQNPVYSKPDEKPTFDEKLESTEKNHPKYPNHDNGNIETDDQTKIIESENTVDQPQNPSDPKPDEHISVSVEGPHIVHHLQIPDDIYPDYDVGTINTDSHEIHIEDQDAHPEQHYYNFYNPNQDSTHGAESEGTENKQPQHLTYFTPNQPPTYDKGHINIDHQAIDTGSEIIVHNPQNPVYHKPDEKPTFDEKLESTEKNHPKYPNHDNGLIETDDQTKIIESENTVDQPQNPSDPKPDKHISVSVEGPHIVHHQEIPDGIYPDYDVGTMNTDSHEIHIEEQYAHPEQHYWNFNNPNQDSTHGAESEGTENKQPQDLTDFTPNQPPSYDKGHIKIDHQAIDTGSEIIVHNPQNPVYPKPDEKPTFDEKLESSEKNQPKYPNHDNGLIETDDQTKIIESENTVDQPQNPSDPKPDKHISVSVEGPHIVHHQQIPDGIYPDNDVGTMNTDIHEMLIEGEHEPYDWNNPNQYYKHDGRSEGNENVQQQKPAAFTPNQPPSSDKGDMHIDITNTESENTVHQQQYPDVPKPDEHFIYIGESERTEENQPHNPNYEKKPIETDDQTKNIESENTVDQQQYPDVPRADEYFIYIGESEGTENNQPQYPTYFTPNQPPSNDQKHINIDNQEVYTESEITDHKPQNQVYPKPDKKPTYDEELESTEKNQPKYFNHDKELIEANDQEINIESEKSADQPQYSGGPKPDEHSRHSEGLVGTNIHLVNTDDQNTFYQPQYPNGLFFDLQHFTGEGSLEAHSHLIKSEGQDTVHPPQYQDEPEQSVDTTSHLVNTEIENTEKPNQYQKNEERSVESDSDLINIESQTAVNQPQNPGGVNPNQHPSNVEGSVESDSHLIDTEGQNTIIKPQYPLIIDIHHIQGDGSVETDNHRINTETENIVNQPQYSVDVKPNKHPSSGDRLVATDSHLINTEDKNIVNQPHYSSVFQPGQYWNYFGESVGTDSHLLMNTEGGNTINQQQYLRGFIPDQYHGNSGQQYYLNGLKPDQVPTYGGGLIGTESQHTGSIEFSHADQNPKYPQESQPNHLSVGSSMEMNSKREKYTDGSGHQSGNTHGKPSDQQVKEGTGGELEQSQLDSTENDQIGSQEVEIEHEINHVSYPEQSSDHMFGTSMDQNYLFKRPVPRVPVTGVMQYLQIPSQHKVVQHVVHHHVHIPTYPQHLSSISGMIEKRKLAECLKKYSSSTCKLLLEDKFHIPETNWYKLYSKYGKPTQQIPVKDPYVDESGAKHFLFSQVYGPYTQQSLPYIKHVPKLEEPSNAQSIEHLQGIHAGKTEEGTYSYPSRFMRPYMPRNNQQNYQMIHPTGFLENNPAYNSYFSSEKSANPAQMKALNEFRHGSSGSVTGSKGKIFHKIVKKIRLRTRSKIRGRMLRRNNIEGSETYEDEDNTTENPNESGEYEGEEPETSEEEKNEKDKTTEDEEKK